MTRAFSMQDGAASAVFLEVLGQRIRVEYSSSELEQLLVATLGSMAVMEHSATPDIQYRIAHGPALPAASARILGPGMQPPGNGDEGKGEEHDAAGEEQGAILFQLEADITLDLQRRRPDLFFLHSAVLAWNGAACLFAGESGIGKSTTAWALLHHGFGYLSDELGPVDLETLTVSSYPRALCLKTPPPPPYGLPAGAVRVGGVARVPCTSLPAPVIDEPLPIEAIVLLGTREDNGEPRLWRLGAAEAAARLYVVALNALAHSGCGLDAAVRIAKRIPCYGFAANGSLRASCDVILRELCQGGPRDR